MNHEKSSMNRKSEYLLLLAPLTDIMVKAEHIFASGIWKLSITEKRS